MFQPFRIRAALRRLAPFCSKNFSDRRKGREKFTHRTRARGNVSTGLVIVAKEETGESLSCGSGSPGDQSLCRLSPAQSGSDVGIFQGPETALARARNRLKEGLSPLPFGRLWYREPEAMRLC